MSAAATWNPSSRSRNAMARPMPLAAPVTTATGAAGSTVRIKRYSILSVKSAQAAAPARYRGPRRQGPAGGRRGHGPAAKTGQGKKADAGQGPAAGARRGGPVAGSRPGIRESVVHGWPAVHLTSDL